MARQPQWPNSANTATFLSHVVDGRLFAVQSWIDAGKPFCDPRNQVREHCPLWRATQVGFHSMVEVLLKAGGWPPDDLNDALYAAMSNGRLDLVDLLLKHGAAVSAIDFEHVCRTVKPELMERFVRAGVDPAKDNAFARALVRIKARPLLRFYKAMREEFPSLDAQASLALAEAVKERKTGWVALLRWAGADPLCRVPDSLYDDWDTVDQDWGATAARNACSVGDPEILKALKLNPTPTQATELLRTSTYSDRPEFIRACLSNVPNHHLNDDENGGCEALDCLISRRHYSFWWGGVSNEQRDSGIVACIEELLDAGAKWRPTLDHVKSVRRSLLEHDSKHIVRVVRLLLYTPGCCDINLLRELCRTPKMREKITQVDAPLWAELHQKS